MSSRTVQSHTADLFAAANFSPQPVQAPVQAPMQAPVSAPPPLIDASARQLWYAAVFPQLSGEREPAQLLERCARYAQRFTSFVSIDPPNALLLEIEGSRRLFGSLERLCACIDAGWNELGIPAYGAAAPSTLAALWLARCGTQALVEDPAALTGCLAELPIACTAWNADRLQLLRAMGVARLGELLRLPRVGLARRLGPDAIVDLDVALARRPAPRRAFVPRERFRERCDFETEMESVAGLERAIEPALVRCVRFLRERQAGVQALALKLKHRAAPTTGVHLGLASVTGEYRRLRDVIAQRLLRLELAAPVRAVELISGPLERLSAGSLDAFGGLGGAGGAGGAGGRDRAAQLIERLRARLGDDVVYGVSSIAEHRPEGASRRVHELRRAAASAACAKADDENAPRPVWLLGEPLLLSAREDACSSRHGLTLEQGPERIESGWWDGKGIARDYYVARRARGARIWVFQERQSKRWYLHGVFA